MLPPAQLGAILISAGKKARTAAQWNTPDDFGAELPAIPTCPSHILAGFAAQPQNRGKLKVVGAFFSNEIYGIGLKKGDSKGVAAVDKALQAMFDDGSWKAALNKEDHAWEADEQDLVLAAWPGEWSQDVFVVDDLKGARVSVGLPRHKATPATASPPHGGAPAQRDYSSPIGLWQRLAESSSLSREARRS